MFFEFKKQVQNHLIDQAKIHSVREVGNGSQGHVVSLSGSGFHGETGPYIGFDTGFLHSERNIFV